MKLAFGCGCWETERSTFSCMQTVACLSWNRSSSSSNSNSRSCVYVSRAISIDCIEEIDRKDLCWRMNVLEKDLSKNDWIETDTVILKSLFTLHLFIFFLLFLCCAFFSPLHQLSMGFTCAYKFTNITCVLKIKRFAASFLLIYPYHEYS